MGSVTALKQPLHKRSPPPYLRKYTSELVMVIMAVDTAENDRIQQYPAV